MAGERVSVISQRHPFKHYIAWLQTQDQSASERYWRDLLKGFHTPTPLPAGSTVNERTQQYSTVQHTMTTEQTAAIVVFSKRNQISINTIVQAAWAYVLGSYGREREVVFGVTVSGRANAPGVENMIGLLINTIPVRIRWQPYGHYNY